VSGPVVGRYRIVPERSRIWVEATSSLHPIRAETNGLKGYLDAEIADGRIRSGTPVTGRVEMDADRLRTGNGLYDYEIERRLEVRKYPVIRGTVRAVEPLGDGPRYRVSGELEFHGITRPVQGEVTFRAVDDRTLEIEGERSFDLREYNLEPPRLLMLKVHPDVRVRGLVVAEQEG
jgi:polyisoprenoid-binding protein YceI